MNYTTASNCAIIEARFTQAWSTPIPDADGVLLDFFRAGKQVRKAIIKIGGETKELHVYVFIKLIDNELKV